MPIAPAGAALPSTLPAAPTPQRPGFAARLGIRGAVPQPSPIRPQPPARSPAHSAVAALAHVDRAQARLDAVLAAARTGRTFTAAELLGLQAEAYRCAQAVDLASKLVDQGAQSVRQALNTPL